MSTKRRAVKNLLPSVDFLNGGLGDPGRIQNLQPGAEYDALYQSALCRKKADWLNGINATRLFSVLYHHTLNVGRVQTPALIMVAERDGKIALFRKEKYHHVSKNGRRQYNKVCRAVFTTTSRVFGQRWYNVRITCPYAPKSAEIRVEYRQIWIRMAKKVAII